MARPAGPQIRFGLLAALQPRTESPSNESGNSPADYASTTATSPSSIASSLRSKLNSRNGPNPMTLFGDYAQLLKTSCLASPIAAGVDLRSVGPATDQSDFRC